MARQTMMAPLCPVCWEFRLTRDPEWGTIFCTNPNCSSDNDPRLLEDVTDLRPACAMCGSTDAEDETNELARRLFEKWGVCSRECMTAIQVRHIGAHLYDGQEAV